jgi:hypothetical protein
MLKDLKELCVDVIVKQNIKSEPLQLPAELETELEEEIWRQKTEPELLILTPDQLCKEGCEDLRTALFILETPNLYRKLGQYNHQIMFWGHEQSPSGESTADVRARYSGERLFKLGEAHPQAATYILEQPHLKEKLSPDYQNLLEKINHLNPEPVMRANYI